MLGWFRIGKNIPFFFLVALDWATKHRNREVKHPRSRRYISWTLSECDSDKNIRPGLRVGRKRLAESTKTMEVPGFFVFFFMIY